VFAGHRPSNWSWSVAGVIVLQMATAAEIRPVLSEAANLSATRPLAHNPEFDLLIACCADSPSHSHAARIRELLSCPLDWKRMLHLVDHHRVVPQVYRALLVLSNLVPSEPLHALRLRYRDNARKALWFTTELVRVVSHLESAGIRALAYKGPILAQTLYGEVTERQFGDLDFLILPADVPKAKASLLEMGQTCGPELRRNQEPAYIGSGCGYVFHSAAGRNLLDLQWRIVPRFYSMDFDIPGFFARAREINFGTQAMDSHPVRTLRSEDLMLVLCVHAAKHVWIQLSWLCDIAQLAKSPQFDWDVIQDEARRFGIERILGLSLFLAHNLLDAPLPSQIQKRLRADPSTALLAGEIQRIIEHSTHYNTESIPYFRLMMRLRERWQDQARFLWRLTVTPSVSEWSAVSLPKPLQPVYRLVRLSRLAKRLAFGIG